MFHQDRNESLTGSWEALSTGTMEWDSAAGGGVSSSWETGVSAGTLMALRAFRRRAVPLLFVSGGRRGAELDFVDAGPSMNIINSSTSRSPRWPGINSVRMISCCWDWRTIWRERVTGARYLFAFLAGSCSWLVWRSGILVLRPLRSAREESPSFLSSTRRASILPSGVTSGR